MEKEDKVRVCEEDMTERKADIPNRNPNSLMVQNIFFTFKVFMAVNVNNTN